MTQPRDARKNDNNMRRGGKSNSPEWSRTSPRVKKTCRHRHGCARVPRWDKTSLEQYLNLSPRRRRESTFYEKTVACYCVAHVAQIHPPPRHAQPTPTHSLTTFPQTRCIKEERQTESFLEFKPEGAGIFLNRNGVTEKKKKKKAQM